jgi:hypothetical protein
LLLCRELASPLKNVSGTLITLVFVNSSTTVIRRIDCPIPTEVSGEMNAKTVFSTALLVAVCGLGTVRGQTPEGMSPLDTAPPPTQADASAEAAPTSQQLPQMFQLSSWILGDKHQCCNCCGGSGPIQTEPFFRIGTSIPLGTGTVASVLQTGWYVGGGARTLFFDTEMCHAWTVELGIANIANHAHAPPYTGIPLTIIVPTATTPALTSLSATLEALNRTYLDVGGGYEWYLWGSAACHERTWRVGCDAGGRWGSEKADFNEIPHRTDVIGGMWTAVHTDLEIPCGCCTFQAGLRIEYGYTWSDIMQIQNKSDTQDLSILFDIGVRF